MKGGKRAILSKKIYKTHVERKKKNGRKKKT
jgi:hypothetical protein